MNDNKTWYICVSHHYLTYNQACPKNKKRNIDDVEDVMLRNLTNLEKKSAQKEDEDELFGKQIAATLRRLTYRQKAHIQGVLLDVEFPAEELTQQHIS